MKKRINLYSDEFKMKVVQEYLNSHLTQPEILEKYSIGGSSSISKWMRKFGLKEAAIRHRNNYTTIMSKGRKKTSQELTLETRVKELEKALEYEKLRALALDTMIEIAEDKLNISIRKKSGTKQ